MRRKKLAFLLLLALGLPAAGLAGAWGFLLLSPHDYLLERQLGKTVRIETSRRDQRWFVREVSRPDDVARLVSAVTTALVSRRRPARGVYDVQARFILETGEAITVLLDPRESVGDRLELGVRCPGETTFGAYAVDARLLGLVGYEPAPKLLGRWIFIPESADARVSLKLTLINDAVMLIGVWLRDGYDTVERVEVVDEKGATHELPDKDAENLRRCELPRRRLRSVRVMLRGETTTFAFPVRFDEAPRLPCHDCGESADVSPGWEFGRSPWWHCNRCKKDF